MQSQPSPPTQPPHPTDVAEQRIGAAAHVNVVHQVSDSALLAANELIKAFVREVWHLGSQASNGVAAALLHLTVEPGYNVSRRARIHRSDAGGRPRRGSELPAVMSPQAAATAARRNEYSALTTRFDAVLDDALAGVPSSPSLRASELQAAAEPGGLALDETQVQATRWFQHLVKRVLDIFALMLPLDAQSLASRRAVRRGDPMSGGAARALQDFPSASQLLHAQAASASQQVAAVATVAEAVAAAPHLGASVRADAVVDVSMEAGLLEEAQLRCLLLVDRATASARRALLRVFQLRYPSLRAGRAMSLPPAASSPLGSPESAGAVTVALDRPAEAAAAGGGSGSSGSMLAPRMAFIRTDAIVQRLRHELLHPAAALTPHPGDGLVPSFRRLVEAVCGYPLEVYKVTTLDGYIINLFRLPRRRSRKCAYFQHGLVDSACAWVSNGSTGSLACRAYEAGFDVFMGNFRGNDAHMLPRPRARARAQSRSSDTETTAPSGGGRSLASRLARRLRSKSSGRALRREAAAAAGADGVWPLRVSSASRAQADGREGREEEAAEAAARGSEQRRHEWLTPEDQAFWDFAVDDHVLDMRACLDAVHALKEGEMRGVYEEWTAELEAAEYERRVRRTHVAGDDRSGGRNDAAGHTAGSAAGRGAGRSAELNGDAARDAAAVHSDKPRAAKPRAAKPRAAKPRAAKQRTAKQSSAARSLRADTGRDGAVATDDDTEDDSATDTDNATTSASVVVQARDASVAEAEASAADAAKIGAPAAAATAAAEARAAAAAAPRTSGARAATAAAARAAGRAAAAADDDDVNDDADDGAAAAAAAGAGARRPEDDPRSVLGPLHVTFAGHSMGGTALLMYLVHCADQKRPARVDKAVALSPAGNHAHMTLHCSFFAHAMKLALAATHSHDGTPFPLRSSAAHLLVAKLLQDMKQTPATLELITSVAAVLLGGERASFPFRHVHYPDYPMGSTSVKVVRQGLACVRTQDFLACDHGRAGNTVRYGQPTPPSYLARLGVINVPVHFVAGGRDSLIPAENIEQMYNTMHASAPHLATFRCFPRAGHLDFTLGLDDELITHVLRELEPTPRRAPQRPERQCRSRNPDAPRVVPGQVRWGYTKLDYDLQPVPEWRTLCELRQHVEWEVIREEQEEAGRNRESRLTRARRWARIALAGARI